MGDYGLGIDMTYYEPGPGGIKNGIYTGDSRELSSLIPDESIDMIVTDPLYHLEHLHYYGWLRETAIRVLKPGAWAFIYGGWLAKEVLDLLYDEEERWDYFMTIALVHNSGHPRWWSKQLFIGYKPIYVFTKGEPKIQKWQSNLAYSDKMDKKFHEFGQGVSFALAKIDMFTEPGDVVFDPFCGGGQVPAACVATGRRYIAFEIDAGTAHDARKRIAHMERPIVVPEPSQLQLGWREREVLDDRKEEALEDYIGY